MSKLKKAKVGSSSPKLLKRAMSLHQAGQVREAAAIYQKILRSEPLHFDALNLLGMAYYQQGRAFDALPLLKSALAVKPQSVAALNHYGLALHAAGRHAEALTAYGRAMALGSVPADVVANRARTLETFGRYAEALADYERVLAVHGNNVEVLVGRGRVLFRLGRHEDAIASFDRARALDPDHLEAQVQSVGPLCELKRFAEALPLCDRVIARFPDNVSGHYNRAVALDGLGDLQHALAAYDETIRLDPNHAVALCNRGDLLERLDRWEQALDDYERAFSIAPDHPKFHAHLCKARLRFGRFSEGAPLFERRWSAAELSVTGRDHPQPRWTGETLAGKLLVWGEQGLGDQVLWSGLIEQAKARSSGMILETDARLVALFQRSFPDIEVVGFGAGFDQDGIDAQLPIGSLGSLFLKTADDFPVRHRGYLIADRNRTDDLKRRLAHDDRLVIGVSWFSKNPIHETTKSARLRDFEALLRQPGCRFVDLQYGNTFTERAQAVKEFGVDVEHRDDIDNTNDIDGLAALISACDIVVTVSNTTAHLAGALGKPTWVFVPQGRAQFWYWFRDRDDSPWYPRVQVKRQMFQQSWSELVSSAADEIVAAAAAVHL